MTTITRPATSALTGLSQRLHRRFKRRASITGHRPTRAPRPRQLFTAPPPRPPAIWRIGGTEVTHALKDSWQ